METVLCAAVGTASHQHQLAACTVYGRSGSVLKNKKAVPNIPAVNSPMKDSYGFHFADLPSINGSGENVRR